MRRLAILSTSVFIAASAEAVQFDPPDLSLELQLHQRYLGDKAVIPPAAEGHSESYRLQKGETLWTLSQMLYGDGQYWPKVWSQNRTITNPHLVRQGHTLQFILGSEDQAPSFRFSEEEEQGIELTAAPNQNPIVEIPPPEVPPKPVLKVPSSFPTWQSVFPNLPEIQIDDRNLGTLPQPLANKILLRAYAQEGPLSSIGEFLEIDAEAGLPVVNQYVYVKMKKGTGAPGMKLLVVKDQGKLIKLSDQVAEKARGHLIQVLGELQLGESVPSQFKRSRDREEYDAYRALVTRSMGLPTGEASLIQGTVEILDLTEQNASAGTSSGQIVGSERHVASAIFGHGDLIFINKGSAEGVERGQLFDIYSNRLTRYHKTPVQISPAAAGTIKVVRVTEHLATAVVLRARESIQQGDFFRQPSGQGNAMERTDVLGRAGSDEEELGEDEIGGEEAPSAPAAGGSESDDDIEQEIEEGENF